jgi:hypothetical protein
MVYLALPLTSHNSSISISNGIRQINKPQNMSQAEHLAVKSSSEHYTTTLLLSRSRRILQTSRLDDVSMRVHQALLRFRCFACFHARRQLCFRRQESLQFKCTYRQHVTRCFPYRPVGIYLQSARSYSFQLNIIGPANERKSRSSQSAKRLPQLPPCSMKSSQGLHPKPPRTPSSRSKPTEDLLFLGIL